MLSEILAPTLQTDARAHSSDDRVPLAQALVILRDAGRDLMEFHRADVAAFSFSDATVDRDRLARFLGLLVD